MPSIDPAITADFLRALFADALEAEAGQIALWFLRTKASAWFTDIPAAAQRACEEAETGDVFVGTCLQRAGVDRKGRGTVEDVSCVCALWADLDLEGGSGDKTYLPDEAAVKELLKVVGLPPTLMVRSGGGLHAWWLLTEPWILSTDQDRQEAIRLAAAWVHTIQVVAKDRWKAHVDSVGDLARILRLPGTLNYKYDPPRLVGTADLSGPRYHLDAFEPLLAVQSLGAEADAAGVEVRPIGMNPAAEPPAQLLNALIENDAKFKQTWNHDRKDFTDRSLSSYDMSLAAIAVSAGWPDQAICDLIIAFRRRHGSAEDQKKAQRRGYLMRTIGTAKKSRAAHVAIARLSDPAGVPEHEGQVDPEANRARIRKDLSAAFGVKIKGWVMDGRHNPDFWLVTDRGRLLIGKAAKVFDCKAFRDQLLVASEQTVVLPMFKAALWLEVVKNLGKILKVEENSDTEPQIVVSGWVSDFVQHGHNGQVQKADVWAGALNQNQPFVRDGCLWIHKQALVDFLNTVRRLGMTPQEVQRQLRAAGWENRTVTGKVNEVAVTRSYWRTPLDGLGHGVGVLIESRT